MMGITLVRFFACAHIRMVERQSEGGGAGWMEARQRRGNFKHKESPRKARGNTTTYNIDEVTAGTV